MAQQAQKTSVNHASEAQMALLAAFYFYQKCQKGDNGSCYMTALCLNQYNALMASSSQSETTAQLSSTNGNQKQPPPKADTSTINGSTVNGMSVGEIKGGLAAKGLTLNPDGSASMNGGPSVPLNSSLASDAGLAAAGLSAQQIAQTKANMEEIKDKLSANGKAAGDFGTGGAGGGGGGGHALADAGGSGAAGKTGAGSGKGSVSGLSKNLGNDKIGVAGDDIFAMITRRYKANEKGLKE